MYEYLLEYVMTPEQLKENSYPLPHPTEKDRAVIEGAYANRTLYCNDRMCILCIIRTINLAVFSLYYLIFVCFSSFLTML